MVEGSRGWCARLNRIEDCISVLKKRQQKLLAKRPPRTQRDREIGWSVVRD